MSDKVRFVIQQRIELMTANPPMVYSQALENRNSGAHEWQVHVLANSRPVDLIGCTVSCYAARSDKKTVYVKGAIGGNVASVVFDSAFYAVNGDIAACMEVTNQDGQIMTVARLYCTVAKTGTDTIIDPSGEIPSLDNLIKLLETMRTEADRCTAAANRAEAMQMDASGLAGDSNALGGKPALWYTHPANLLDNSDFRRPINQRGKTNYTTAGADTIDRWNISANTESLNVNSGGVTLTAKADGYAFLRQTLDRQHVAGKTVTFAACTSSGVIAAVSAALPATAPDSDVTYAGANVGGMDVYISGNASEVIVQIRTALGGAIGLAWAALYEGAYTAATLPPYVPKDEAVELAACRRRYQRIGAAGFAATFGFGIIQSIADNLLRIFVPLPQALRANPAAVFTGTMTIMGYSPSGQATTTAVSITAAYATSTGVEIVMVPAAAIVSGSMYIVRMNSGSYLELTA